MGLVIVPAFLIALLILFVFITLALRVPKMRGWKLFSFAVVLSPVVWLTWDILVLTDEVATPSGDCRVYTGSKSRDVWEWKRIFGRDLGCHETTGRETFRMGAGDTPVIATGELFGKVNAITRVNGHSLGGYLATPFTQLFGAKILAVTTFNSAGFSNAANQDAWKVSA